MTSSPFGAMEVFHPFRESSRTDHSKAHYSRPTLERTVSNNTSARSSSSKQQNNGMLLMGGSSSSLRSGGADDYAHAFPLCSSDSRQSNLLCTQSNSERGGDSAAWNSSSHTARTTSSSRDDNNKTESSGEVMIEEKRRRANGDGYTVHQYLRGRLLGKGGFAKVYLCTALDTGKNYAVKVVPKANLVKARARQKVRSL